MKLKIKQFLVWIFCFTGIISLVALGLSLTELSEWVQGAVSVCITLMILSVLEQK